MLTGDDVTPFLRITFPVGFSPGPGRDKRNLAYLIYWFIYDNKQTWNSNKLFKVILQHISFFKSFIKVVIE